MLIAIAFALQVLQGPGTPPPPLVQVNPTNWVCALPLEERDWRRSMDAGKLAKQIAEKCALPFIVDETNGTPMADQHAIYLARGRKFEAEIERDINAKRLEKGR